MKGQITWSEVWRQVKNVAQRHGAPQSVIDEVDGCAWCVTDGEFHLYCEQCLYDWIEAPSKPGMESNLQFIKPVLWPAMRRLDCRKLIYHLNPTKKQNNG